jgi:hypothetical protein
LNKGLRSITYLKQEVKCRQNEVEMTK